MNGSPRLQRDAVASLFLLVAACGGGGDPPADAPAPPSEPASATCDIADFKATALARINQWRASGADCGTQGVFGPAPALAWNDRLTQAAAGHSHDMVEHNFLSHVGSDGRTFGQRIAATGYASAGAGEYAAGGYRTIQEVIDGWIDSDGHCATLMHPGFKDVGLACERGTAANTYPTYWTMDLAAPK